jgi:hypothetical protein
MRRNLGLSSPLYEIPFDDDTLLVIGRIALMWGQIVFHLDGLLRKLKEIPEEDAPNYATRSLSAKLRDLTTELSKPQNKAHRPALRKVHRCIDRVSSDRNVVFHGLWGIFLQLDMSGWRVAAKSYGRKEPFFADDLKELHERMVDAAGALDDAWHALGLAIGPQPKVRNRRQLWVPKGTLMTPREPRRWPR